MVVEEVVKVKFTGQNKTIRQTNNIAIQAAHRDEDVGNALAVVAKVAVRTNVGALRNLHLTETYLGVN